MDLPLRLERYPEASVVRLGPFREAGRRLPARVLAGGVERGHPADRVAQENRGPTSAGDRPRGVRDADRERSVGLAPEPGESPRELV